MMSDGGGSPDEVRLVVADDHPVVVQGIVRFCALEDGFEVIGTAGTIDELMAVLDEARPDVVSLDVQLPGMRGPKTVEAVCARGVPVLLFTLHPLDATIAALVSAGARGYHSKSGTIDEYLHAVRTVAQGGEHLPPELRALAATTTARPPEELLTERELEVFRHLAECETPKETAYALGLSPSTVYTYLDRIRAKLGVSTQAELVRLAASWELDASARRE